MKAKNTRGGKDAVAIHDGKSWRLFVKSGAGVRCASTQKGAGASLSDEFLDAAENAGAGRIRFILSGELHRVDGLSLDGLSFKRANDGIGAAVTEAAGIEAEDLVFAGASFSWTGVRKPFTLAAKFSADMVEDFKVALDGYGIACGGFGSLEAALLSAWLRRGAAKEAFAAFGDGGALIVPGRRGANPGPQYAACGMRHLAADEGSWVARLRRALPESAKAQKLNVLMLAGAADEVVETLHAVGFANANVFDADEWLADVALEALKTKANKNRPGAFALVNPFEPLKKFSNGWIVAAALAILALPVAFRFSSEAHTGAALAKISSEAAAYRPLEQRVNKAKSDYAAERRAYDMTDASIAARVSSRRPLYAFVEVAYFFCKNAGGTVVLDSIVQKGDRIEGQGTFVDPEDGVKLGKDFVAFAKKKNIGIVENSTVREEGAAFVNRFRFVLDTAKVGK